MLGGNNNDVDEFLTLDDVRRGNDLDLNEDTTRPPPRGTLLARTPVSFLPSTDATSGTLVSHKGDVIGRRDDFRMNTSVIAENGALLLLDSAASVQNRGLPQMRIALEDPAANSMPPPMSAVGSGSMLLDVVAPGSAAEAENMRAMEMPLEMDGGYGDDDDELSMGSRGAVVGSDNGGSSSSSTNAPVVKSLLADDDDDELAVGNGDFVELDSPSFVSGRVRSSMLCGDNLIFQF